MSNVFIAEERLQAQTQKRNRERRERIATAALEGLCARFGEISYSPAGIERKDPERDALAVARAAARYADALIAELDKQP